MGKRWSCVKALDSCVMGLRYEINFWLLTFEIILEIHFKNISNLWSENWLAFHVLQPYKRTLLTFNFVLQSLCHTYGGHSSHVTNVSFLQDDSRLISTGGRDTSVMQWALSWVVHTDEILQENTTALSDT
jgi:WD40 repeat protein